MNVQERITALVDGEIIDEIEKAETEKLVFSDDNLKFDFDAQNIVKKLLREKFAETRTPEYLTESIKSKLMAETKVQSNYSKGASYWELFLKPQVVIPLAAASILIIIFFYSSASFTPEKLVAEQTGQNNMFVQAVNNFSSIIDGKLSAQITSDDPQKISKFFVSAGVNYSTVIPKCKDWTLAGGVVSDEKGIKFAHHLYSDNQRHIVYIYQADIDFIQDKRVLTLTDDLMEYLKHNELVLDYNKFASAIWLKDHKVFVLVSNDSLSKIKRNFLTSLN